MIEYLFLSTNGVAEDVVNGFTSLVGNPMWLGMFVLIFFIFFMIGLAISIDVAIVVFIPIVFIVSNWIPALQTVFLVIIGFFIGLGLLRLIGRR